MFWKSKKNKDIDYNNLPKHIAIIMDGNGRWAKSHGMPRSLGHKAGADNVKKISRFADKIGIKYMTVYAFSTENWKRPKAEVDFLMNLLLEYLKEAEKTLVSENGIVKIIGDRSVLTSEINEQIDRVENLTKNNSGNVLNIAINYGGREEILLAVRHLSKKVLDGAINVNDIDEAVFKSEIYTANMPDPDLIIRTSGEQRLSNFLLWQAAYSEFWYTKKNWPDFSKDDLLSAICDYQNRHRRFGGVDSE